MEAYHGSVLGDAVNRIFSGGLLGVAFKKDLVREERLTADS